jgi:hypothetical protein
MTVEQLSTAKNASPFRPFTIRLADGRSFLVRHPDFLSRSPSGRTVIVHGDGDSYSVLDLLLVTELEFHATAPQSGGAAA